MNVAGWAFLVVSWLVITGLTIFCVARVLGSGKKVDPDETPLE